MTSRRSLRLARNNQDSLSRDINETINSIPSTPQRSRLQTVAYLLGARQDMPDLDDKEIKRACAVRLWYSSDTTEEQPVDQQPLNKKVEFRVPLNTADTNKSTTYVDCFYDESDHPLDIFDSMKATMDLPKNYEHLGWRLPTARRTDAPHQLLNSQDIASAFKNVRAEQMSGRKNKTVAIEIVNTMPMLKGKPTKQLVGLSLCSAGKQNLAVSNRSPPLYTKELEHVKSRLRCSEHRLGDSENTATFCWADMSQPTAPHYPLCTQDLQEWAKYLHDIREPDNACLTLPSTPHFNDFHKTRKEMTVSLRHVPTELIPTIYNHVHLSSIANEMWGSSGALSGQEVKQSVAPQPLKRTFALYIESDEETDDDEMLQEIEDVLMNIHSRYPAMNFPQYTNSLRERGILYLSMAANFDSRFYVEKVGMSEGTALTFHSHIRKAHLKEERAKARRKAKGKKKARDDTDKENI